MNACYCNIKIKIFIKTFMTSQVHNIDCILENNEKWKKKFFFECGWRFLTSSRYVELTCGHYRKNNKKSEAKEEERENRALIISIFFVIHSMFLLFGAFYTLSARQNIHTHTHCSRLKTRMCVFKMCVMCSMLFLIFVLSLEEIKISWNLWIETGKEEIER